MSMTRLVDFIWSCATIVDDLNLSEFFKKMTDFENPQNLSNDVISRTATLIIRACTIFHQTISMSGTTSTLRST